MLLTNARLILANAVVSGTILVRQGMIIDIQPGRLHVAGAIDLAGDFLLPGAIDLHTDNLERQVQPRTGTRWPSRSALLAHDAQCAAAGITTVLDALCVGDLGFDEDRTRTCLDCVADLDALAPSGLLKAEHYLHLRCELPAPAMMGLLAGLAGHRALRLVSLMDHTPGSGQYADLDRYRALRRRDGEAADSIERRIDMLQARRRRGRQENRVALLALMRGRSPCVALASHDDRSDGDVAANIADGIGLAEFPVTRAAARAARQGGQKIIAGAPNVVRGGSHTGNVAVADLLDDGDVDALASDYVPGSLIEAAFIAHSKFGLPLPQAVRLISAAPAAMINLPDRGNLAIGQRADLVRVRLHEGAPVVREVWCAGMRVI